MRSAGNLNNLVGTPASLLCLDAQSDLAVMEIGTSAPGEIARLAQICAPEVGVVTAVAPAHTARLASLDQVAAEKASLLAALPAHGTAIHRAGDRARACAELDHRPGRAGANRCRDAPSKCRRGRHHGAHLERIGEPAAEEQPGPRGR